MIDSSVVLDVKLLDESPFDLQVLCFPPKKCCPILQSMVAPRIQSVLDS